MSNMVWLGRTLSFLGGIVIALIVILLLDSLLNFYVSLSSIEPTLPVDMMVMR